MTDTCNDDRRRLFEIRRRRQERRQHRLSDRHFHKYRGGESERRKRSVCLWQFHRRTAGVPWDNATTKTHTKAEAPSELAAAPLVLLSCAYSNRNIPPAVRKGDRRFRRFPSSVQRPVIKPQTASYDNDELPVVVLTRKSGSRLENARRRLQLRRVHVQRRLTRLSLAIPQSAAGLWI